MQTDKIENNQNKNLTTTKETAEADLEKQKISKRILLISSSWLLLIVAMIVYQICIGVLSTLTVIILLILVIIAITILTTFYANKTNPDNRFLKYLARNNHFSSYNMDTRRINYKASRKHIFFRVALMLVSVGVFCAAYFAVYKKDTSNLQLVNATILNQKIIREVEVEEEIDGETISETNKLYLTVNFELNSVPMEKTFLVSNILSKPIDAKTIEIYVDESGNFEFFKNFPKVGLIYSICFLALAGIFLLTLILRTPWMTVLGLMMILICTISTFLISLSTPSIFYFLRIDWALVSTVFLSCGLLLITGVGLFSIYLPTPKDLENTNIDFIVSEPLAGAKVQDDTKKY